MKKVIAVRHGRYSGSSLTSRGVADVEVLAKQVGRVPEDETVVVVHSTLTRAVETAEIIATQLGVSLIACREMQSDEYYDAPRIVESIQELVDLGKFDVLVTVGHYDAPAGIIHSYKESNGFGGFPCQVIEKGRALVLDLSSGSVEEL